jgi:signal transduction histidine kinase
LFTEVDLNETVAIVNNDLELVIADKRASILVEPLPVVKAVPQQMHQLFYNLINNALKFARTGVPPVVDVRCRLLTEAETKEGMDLKPGRPYYLIRVEDNGIGFDQKAKDKIFVLFQRLHSKDSYPGTGIGLALCKKVVSNHGGKITAHSTPGVGSVFEIYLPALDS